MTCGLLAGGHMNDQVQVEEPGRAAGRRPPEKGYEYYGVCADQLDPLFPELIYNRQRPFQNNYQELIPVCINAIKDLNAKVDALSSRFVANTL